MPRPGGGHVGHSKHHQAFGHNPRSSRQKLNMQMDAEKREREKVKKPRPEMKDSIRELFEKV